MQEVTDAGTPAGSATPTDQNQGVQPETIVDAGTTTPPAGEKAEAGTPPDSQPKEKPKGGFQRRIDQLTRQNHELRRAQEELMARVNQLPKPKQESGERPKADDFKTLDEYLEALSDWKIEQRLKEKAEREKSERERDTNEQDIRRAVASFSEKAEKVREEYEDFDEVVFESDYTVTPVMYQAVMTSDMAPKIAYYLGKNPNEAARIAVLPPPAQMREIGKIEAKLSAPAPTQPKPSGAPAPITPVSGGKGSDGSPSDSDDIKTWISKRNKQVRGK